MEFNEFTFWVWVSFVPVYLVWELIILFIRGEHNGSLPQTISMVARDRGWHLSSMVYLWGGLSTHFWWPSAKYATKIGGIAFWVIMALLLAEDIFLWNRPVESWPMWLKYQRWPLLILFAAAIAGKLLFPQQGASPWNNHLK